MYLDAFLESFSDELMKIAAEGMGGALAGGMIGTGIGTLFKSPKAALVGGLLGAGIGGLTGGAAHLGRRILEPSPGMYGPPTGDPNYVPTYMRPNTQSGMGY